MRQSEEYLSDDKRCWRCETYKGSGEKEIATHEITFPGNGEKGYCCEICWPLHMVAGGYNPILLRERSKPLGDVRI